MRISHSSYQNYIAKIAKEIEGEKLYSPLLLSNKVLVLPFMEKAKTILAISLNPKCPLLYLTQSDKFFSSFENSFLAKFRKHIGKSLITNLKLKEDDLILTCDIHSIENEDNYKLVVELIPNKPNLIILDENEDVVDYYFSSKIHPLIRGEKYIFPNNEKLIEGDIRISDEFITKKYEEDLEIRAKEKYADFLKFLNNKIKGTEKKISAINEDVEKAEKNLLYRGIADDILSNETNLKAHKSSVIVDGKTYHIDESKTILENTQNFYKRAKKAKETIERSKLNIENAKNEQAMYQKILDEFIAADEYHKDELVHLYSNSKKKKETKKTIVNRPWKINLNGTIIYFGRNASQNDYLSFVMKLDREFTWMHIKDKSGAHLVIANRKPTENELLTAAEIALICSHSSAGEVSYTKKKNVRRGHVLGEAILKNHTVIKLNSVRKETAELFKTAVRLD